MDLPPAVYPEVKKYFTHESWEGLSAQVESAISSGNSYQYDAEVVRPDGEHRWITARGKAVRGNDGQPIKLQGTVQDITERKHAEEALRASEERFKFLSEATVEGVHIHDNGVVLDANLAFAKLIGYDSVDEILGKQIITEHLSPESLEKVKNILASGYEGTYEIVGIKKDGSQFPVEIISKNIDFYGKSARVTAARDITERKSVEQSLKWNVRRNELLSETAYHLLQSSDPQNRIKDICIKVTQFLDCQLFTNFLNDSNSKKLKLNAYSGMPHEKAMEIEWIDYGTNVSGKVAQTHRPIILENIMNLPEPLNPFLESIGIQSYCCFPLIIEDRFLGTLAFGRQSQKKYNPEELALVESIASLVAIAVNRIETEKSKIQLETQLQQAQKVEAIGRLAGGVAHDFNNLLSPILGYSQLLLDDLSAEDERRVNVNEIINASYRARDLVRQLLAFSRKQVIKLKQVNMNTIVEGIEKLLLHTVTEDIKIIKNLEQNLPPIMADIGQVEQILMNLSVNAADAMPDGGILRIETGLFEMDEDYLRSHPHLVPGQYVMLSVSDTGSGMDKETIKHVFEPFYSTKGEQGTGLGLATVHGIVNQHNGHVWVYSEPKMGTTFKIYIPAVEETVTEEISIKHKLNSLKGTETILLVEDDEQVFTLGRMILERQGYTVIGARNGEKALKALASHEGPLHLLLTDVVMPGMNGKELYDKTVQSHPGLKVLFMSGYTDDVIARRGVLEEGIQLIQKPFSLQSLAEKVREVLELE